MKWTTRLCLALSLNVKLTKEPHSGQIICGNLCTIDSSNELELCSVFRICVQDKAIDIKVKYQLVKLKAYLHFGIMS